MAILLSCRSVSFELNIEVGKLVKKSLQALQYKKLRRFMWCVAWLATLVQWWHSWHVMLTGFGRAMSHVHLKITPFVSFGHLNWWSTDLPVNHKMIHWLHYFWSLLAPSWLLLLRIPSNMIAWKLASSSPMTESRSDCSLCRGRGSSGTAARPTGGPMGRRRGSIVYRANFASLCMTASQQQVLPSLRKKESNSPADECTMKITILVVSAPVCCSGQLVRSRRR